MKAPTHRNKRGAPFYKDLEKPVERNCSNQQTASHLPSSTYRDKDPCRADWYRLARSIEASLKRQFGLLVTDFQLSTSVLKALKGRRLKGHAFPVRMNRGSGGVC